MANPIDHIQILCHDICNKLVAVQYCMAIITPDKIIAEDARNAYHNLNQSIEDIEGIMHEISTLIHNNAQN